MVYRDIGYILFDFIGFYKDIVIGYSILDGFIEFYRVLQRYTVIPLKMARLGITNS